jgi:hypothetical protein
MNDLVPAESNPYQLTGQDFTALDPLSTVHEIALVRHTLAKAIAEGAPPTVVAQIAAVVGKLSKDFALQSVRSGKMVHLDRVHAYLKECCGAIALAFSDVPDWESRIDKAIATIAPPENSQKQINDLCGRER